MDAGSSGATATRTATTLMRLCSGGGTSPVGSSISAVAVASYTPLHVNGTRKENCTSDELGGASVVGVDGVVVEGVDGSGSIVVDVEGAVVVVE